MKITQDVRKYAAEKGMDATDAVEQGMKEQSEVFLQSGAELYQDA